jgi:hypothetical protein
LAGARTPDELEQVVAAAERSEIDYLPADFRGRWIRYLDSISLHRFGKAFDALLTTLRDRVAAVWGAQGGSGTILYAEYALPQAEPSQNARAILEPKQPNSRVNV